ncbi:hypothetical protein GDO81_003417 [Engystomops pustulosus]|uniref:Uncharacterized protein n=1 Tax=Engystomops pustulosus TaxID=76066 RepID=A0AAV7A127_ENGPU|nr:hypothetical protein GDO81_003417 [Engystomops pustulosus]
MSSRSIFLYNLSLSINFNSTSFGFSHICTQFVSYIQKKRLGCTAQAKISAVIQNPSPRPVAAYSDDS